MILVDLNDSYHNILKSPHIARKKVPLLWGQKSCFFFLHQKGTTRQELSESPSYNLT
jgi:hypothetical protein